MSLPGLRSFRIVFFFFPSKIESTLEKKEALNICVCFESYVYKIQKRFELKSDSASGKSLQLFSYNFGKTVS